jgi:hypothetical protein
MSTLISAQCFKNEKLTHRVVQHTAGWQQMHLGKAACISGMSPGERQMPDLPWAGGTECSPGSRSVEDEDQGKTPGCPLVSLEV